MLTPPLGKIIIEVILAVYLEQPWLHRVFQLSKSENMFVEGMIYERGNVMKGLIFLSLFIFVIWIFKKKYLTPPFKICYKKLKIVNIPVTVLLKTVN